MIGRLTIVRPLPLLGLCAALVGAGACRRHAADPASLFPRSYEAAGWARTGEIRTFPAADLWKYIDGEAERYLKAGVERTSTADYRFQGKSDAVLDIYAMAEGAGAQKIFESEPASGSHTVAVGDGGRLHRQSLVFRKGHYLVRITAYEDSAELEQALLVLARRVDERLRN